MLLSEYVDLSSRPLTRSRVILFAFFSELAMVLRRHSRWRVFGR